MKKSGQCKNASGQITAIKLQLVQNITYNKAGNVHSVEYTDIPRCTSHYIMQVVDALMRSEVTVAS
jgi:hypothetical protein